MPGASVGGDPLQDLSLGQLAKGQGAGGAWGWEQTGFCSGLPSPQGHPGLWPWQTSEL